MEVRHGALDFETQGLLRHKLDGRLDGDHR